MDGFFASIGSFFGVILYPLEWVVSGLLVLFHAMWEPLLATSPGWAWTLSIICLTVVIRILLFPLFVRQIKSMRRMQQVQPKMAEIRKKYGSDREKMAIETQKLMREEGVNPLASCLPLLLQMPIFFALFNVLNGAAAGRAQGYWMAQNPELVEQLGQSTIFGARIADRFLPITDATGALAIGNVQLVTIILILLMTATMFYTQLQLTRRNMPPEALEGPMAQQQKMMLYLFPIIFAVGGVNFPVGVLIYWLTTNLWTMGQQAWIIRNNPTPNTPAYAAWEARIIAKGGDPREKDPTYAKRKAEEEERAKAAAEAEAAPRVQRQQPNRQSRSNRRTGSSGGGSNRNNPGVKKNGGAPKKSNQNPSNTKRPYGK
ncbi:membrane protein insertase YidC [Naumannella halotolerans]|uniref:Membrane protein insertase YidC n=1 Tax=Naumannella halotolerans TaxID=993414 RepID=A0A4R7J1H2_9ACTN|nr:membrane protein insertase YidC [Naumannella halotolerans]TDT31002.1 YidC/Oxa1 family membrane protein insertase [Naumannella halotolerans]